MAQPEISEPLPVSLPPDGLLPLSDQINISTRSTHTQLNRLIIDRLPLALPPYTTNPSTYITGLLFIAPIYITFESAWEAILDAPNLPTNLTQAPTVEICEPSKPLLDSRRPPIVLDLGSTPIAPKALICSRTQSLLEHILIPGLLRSGRLRDDIRTLSGISEVEVEAQLDEVSQNGKLAEFITHIHSSCRKKPHILLAYAWVLYMALFSGGRYIRSSLAAAGQDFWSRPPSPVRPCLSSHNNSDYTVFRSTEFAKQSIDRSKIRRKSKSESSLSSTLPGMQFFNFTGDGDGEDLKLEFKRRLLKSEILLTNGEKEDIVRESEQIFSYMVDMIAQLDSVLETTEDDISLVRQQESKSFWRSRDSVFVARDRMTRRKDSSYTTEIRNSGSSSSSLELPAAAPAVKTVHFAESVKVHLAELGRGVEAITRPLGRRFSRSGSVLVSTSASIAGQAGETHNDENLRSLCWDEVVSVRETALLITIGIGLALLYIWTFV